MDSGRFGLDGWVIVLYDGKKKNKMKIISVGLLLVFSALSGTPKEIPLIDSIHSFQGGNFTCTETYRENEIYAVANCLDYEWSILITIGEKNFERMVYSDYYGPGGGGVFKLYSGDFDSNGKIDLMACLYNGGRSGSGANQNKIVFFLQQKGKLELFKTGWVENFDPDSYRRYIQEAHPVGGINSVPLRSTP